MAYFKNIDRFGNEIINGGAAIDFNPIPINYTPAASGNTQNLNSFVIDPNGDTYFIDNDGQSFKINTSNPLDVLITVQPTPTSTGNTTNLNTVFKDGNGDTWVVDWKGDAVRIITPVAAPTITRAGVYATFENKTILPNTLTQITAYNTVSDTSAGAWNSTAGTFTAPRAGWYDITANVSTLISDWVAGSENTIAIYKNGVRTIAGTNWFYITNGNTTQPSAYAHQAIATGKLYLNAGDVIDVRHFHTSQTTKSTWTPERSNFSIVELGTTL